MPSRTSFFSPAIYRKNLTRFAPLWLGYLALWLVVMPLNVLSHRGSEYFTIWSLMRMALSVETSVMITLPYAILTAMAVHSWYYKSASVNAMAAFPIRREAWFGTNLLTGLTVGLVPHLIVALLTWAAAASMGLAGGMAALNWLSITSLVYLFFYALATLCAAVVGQILALPVLYLLVNFTAAVVCYAVVSILSTFVYGMNAHGRVVLAPLSPAYYLFSRPTINTEYYPAVQGVGADEIRALTFAQWGYLLGLTVAAVVMLGIAFLLFRHRRMESAGDVIAVRPLRPVFKYCFSAGCALVLGTLAAFLFFEGSGASLTVMLICLLLGGLVGYFTAEILLKKTFRVFGREWIGYGVFALCLTVAVLAMEFDVTGFECRVPRLEDVESVSVFASGNSSMTLDDPAYIADFMSVHQAIIEDKAWQESMSHSRQILGGRVDTAYIYLDYNLKNGKVIERYYDVYCTEEQWRDANSAGRRLNDLLTDPALVMLSCLPSFPIEGPENILSVELRNYAAGTLRDYQQEYPQLDIPTSKAASDLTLTQAEGYELFTTCILPDIRDGKVWGQKPYNFSSDTGREYCASLDINFFKAPNSHGWSWLNMASGSRTAQYFIDRGYLLLTNDEVNAIVGTLE